MPFAQGLAWLLQSLALIRMQPGRLLLIAVLMQLMLGLTRLPLIGFLVILAVPALTAGILEAFHVTARGGPPGPAHVLGRDRPLPAGRDYPDRPRTCQTSST